MPSIARLGHVGIHAQDLGSLVAFYRDVLGLTVTDEDPQAGMVFLSARPDEEHHELLLCGGRDVEGRDALLLQQVSFRCDRLDDVIGYFLAFKERGVPIDMTVSHGNAVGLYFRDPEGNRCEVYWGTGMRARQPYLQLVNLDEPQDEIIRKIRESVAEHGETGIVDRGALSAQDIQG
jgi:catechol-2,3-dioxygenase